MYLKLVNFLSGTVEVTVESAFPERVLNLCSSHDLSFWDITWKSPTCFSMKLQRRHYRKLRGALKNLDCTVNVVQKQVAPYFMGRFRRRYVLLAGLAAAVALLFLGSFFVWDIEVEGNSAVSEQEILRVLEKNGVGYGTFGLGIRPEQLKARVLPELPELSWLTVNVKGFRATVIVRERRLPPEVRSQKQPANIVAEKDGLITRVKLYGGHAAVEEGATVIAGELLISGIADVGERSYYVTRAEGEVWARTWYDLTLRLPKTAREKRYTGEEKTNCTMIVGKQRINITRGSSIFDGECDKIRKIRKWKLSEDRTLPIQLEWVTRREFTLRERTLSPEEAQRRAEPVLRQQLEDRLHEGGTVKASHCSLRDCGDLYEVTLQAECEEQIGRTVEFSE